MGMARGWCSDFFWMDGWRVCSSMNTEVMAVSNVWVRNCMDGFFSQEIFWEQMEFESKGSKVNGLYAVFTVFEPHIGNCHNFCIHTTIYSPSIHSKKSKHYPLAIPRSWRLSAYWVCKEAVQNVIRVEANSGSQNFFQLQGKHLLTLTTLLKHHQICMLKNTM